MYDSRAYCVCGAISIYISALYTTIAFQTKYGAKTN